MSSSPRSPVRSLPPWDSLIRSFSAVLVDLQEASGNDRRFRSRDDGRGRGGKRFRCSARRSLSQRAGIGAALAAELDRFTTTPTQNLPDPRPVEPRRPGTPAANASTAARGNPSRRLVHTTAAQAPTRTAGSPTAPASSTRCANASSRARRSAIRRRSGPSPSMTPTGARSGWLGHPWPGACSIRSTKADGCLTGTRRPMNASSGAADAELGRGEGASRCRRNALVSTAGGTTTARRWPSTPRSTRSWATSSPTAMWTSARAASRCSIRPANHSPHLGRWSRNTCPCHVWIRRGRPLRPAPRQARRPRTPAFEVCVCTTSGRRPRTIRRRWNHARASPAPRTERPKPGTSTNPRTVPRQVVEPQHRNPGRLEVDAGALRSRTAAHRQDRAGTRGLHRMPQSNRLTGRPADVRAG